LRQRGVPIGGTLSSAVVGLVFAHREHVFGEQVPLFRDFVAPSRYVGDVILGSNSMCQNCQSNVVTQIYSSMPKWEISKPEKGRIKWLYLAIFSDGRVARFEAAIVLNFEGDEIPKAKIKPFIDTDTIDWQYLRVLLLLYPLVWFRHPLEISISWRQWQCIYFRGVRAGTSGR
jgi:hypothetical protein